MKYEHFPLWLELLKTPTVATIAGGILAFILQIKFDIFNRKRPVLKNFYYSTNKDGYNSMAVFSREKSYFIFDCFCEGRNITDVYYKVKFKFRIDINKYWENIKKKEKIISSDIHMLQTKHMNHSSVLQNNENSSFVLDSINNENYDILTLLYEHMIVYAYVKDAYGRKSNKLNRKILFLNDSKLKTLDFA
jgi:hypothetical protein